ncbi:fibroblast growth factor 19 [Monodon monoceros]|uniref:fibroblast growth factor 19 n=1 Tax=Monodon monoceros TaxID=40151 RepID=UPI0010F47D75|nr:fibroblast growth factor 19 [Monodon monoceros]
MPMPMPMPMPIPMPMPMPIIIMASTASACEPTLPPKGAFTTTALPGSISGDCSGPSREEAGRRRGAEPSRAESGAEAPSSARPRDPIVPPRVEVAPGPQSGDNLLGTNVAQPRATWPQASPPRRGPSRLPPSLPHPHRPLCAQTPEPEGGAMRSAPSRCAVARALVLAGLWLAAAGRPLAFSDAGPHVHYGWGESVRLRHLYTAGPQGLSSCFLRIHSDGAVDCAPVQSAHSLMEIRAVALSTVAIKGERSVLYLCMGADGKMQGLSQYSAEDCAFEEEIRPDGYNVYWSKKHHLPVSLSSARQRQLFKGRGFLPLSHFLPMLSTIPTEPDEIQDHLKPDLFALPLKTDSMDPFGLATKLGVVKSPSFYK